MADITFPSGIIEEIISSIYFTCFVVSLLLSSFNSS